MQDTAPSYEQLIKENESLKNQLFDSKDLKTVFGHILFHAEDAFLIIQDHVFVECNQAAELFLGGTHSQIIGKPIKEFCTKNQLFPFDLAQEAKLNKSAADQESNLFEWKIKSLDGNEKIGRVRYTQIYFKSKIALFCSISEITRQKEVLTNLLKSDLTYESIFELDGKINLLIDAETGEICNANKTAIEFYGFPIEVFLKKRIYEINIATVKEVEYEMLQVKNNIKKFFSFNHRIASGEIKNVEVYSNTIEIKNKVFIFSTIIDITPSVELKKELRKNEERFSQIATHSKTIIWEVDTNGLYTYVNSVANLVWGIKQDQIINKLHFYDLHPDQGREEFKKVVFDVFEKKLSFERLINPKVTASGKKIWVESNAYPILDDAQNLIGYRGSDVDITAQRESEKEIKFQNDQIRILSEAIKQSPLSILVSDLDHIITFANPTFEYETGYSQKEVIGKPIRMLISDKEDDSVYKNILDTVLKGNQWAGELIAKNKNETYYLVELQVAPIKNENNIAISYLTISQNITKRKESELKIWELNTSLELKIKERTAQLEKTNINLLAQIQENKKAEVTISNQETKYRTVVENLNEIVFQTNPNGLWTYLNKSWEIVTGFSIEESLNQLFVNYIHPDDRAKNWELFEPLIQRKKEYCRHEIRYLTKDGGFRWIEVFAKLGLDDNNEIIGTFGTLSDIHTRKIAEFKLKASELRLSTILEHSSESIGVHENGIWGLCNLATLNLFGYAHHHELIGKPILNVIALNERERILDYVKRRTANETAESEYITRGLRKDSTEFDLEISVATFELEDKKQVITLMRNVTTKQRESEELISARKEAENANIAKSEFLSRMSHELRTPLNSILGFAQLLEMDNPNPRQLKGINHIKNGGTHLLHLIDEILDISKIEAGKINISVEPIDLYNIILEMVDQMLPQIINANLSIELIKSTAKQLYIHADLNCLKQIFYNLFSNAIKYNTSGGSIKIKTKLKNNSNNEPTKVKISVIDTGFGISNENITKLFIPFERFEAQPTIEGTGLGLTVIKKLVEAMGGTLGVESKLGIGSTFWFELPLANRNTEGEIFDMNSPKV